MPIFMKRIRIDAPERVDQFMRSFSSGHSEDFKAAALKLLATNHSVDQVAMGVGRTTLYEWIEQWNKKRAWTGKPPRTRGWGAIPSQPNTEAGLKRIHLRLL